MSATRAKGDLAELAIATDLLRRGYRVALPFGDAWSFDLILCRTDDVFERVQVKYVDSHGEVAVVKCGSMPARGNDHRPYTPTMIDWLAAYDAHDGACYYLPSMLLGANGRNSLRLRVAPSRNRQEKGLRWARDFTTI